jgi:hypothetical protein
VPVVGLLLGFDTAEPLSGGLWEELSAALSRPPQVANGYLDAFAITPAQVAVARGRGARLLLCANGTGPDVVRGSFEDGYLFAEARVVKARALGAPPGVGIAVDIEAEWEPAAAWVGGFAAGVLAGGYRPLAYGVPRRPAFRAALEQAAARYAAVREHLAVWSATPEPGGAPAVPPWAPDRCAGLEVVGWQWQENWSLPSGQAVDLDLWQEEYPGFWQPPHPAAPPSRWARVLRRAPRSPAPCPCRR